MLLVEGSWQQAAQILHIHNQMNVIHCPQGTGDDTRQLAVRIQQRPPDIPLATWAEVRIRLLPLMSAAGVLTIPSVMIAVFLSGYPRAYTASPCLSFSPATADKHRHYPFASSRQDLAVQGWPHPSARRT